MGGKVSPGLVAVLTIAFNSDYHVVESVPMF